nr:MAG TPA: hypothetical protein [Caudoviricetes sp.]
MQQKRLVIILVLINWSVQRCAKKLKHSSRTYTSKPGCLKL